MDDYAGLGVPTFGPSIERWCECEHPLSWHDDEGICHAPMGADDISIGYDCNCQKFTEAQGDTLESLGVDVL